MVMRRTLEQEVGGFQTYLCHVVSLSKTLYFPKVLVIPRKRCLHPNMTEKLLTGKLNLNTNKQNNNSLYLTTLTDFGLTSASIESSFCMVLPVSMMSSTTKTFCVNKAVQYRI